MEHNPKPGTRNPVLAEGRNKKPEIKNQKWHRESLRFI